MSVSVGENGVELYGTMTKVSLGPLRIDRPPSARPPASLSRLGPNAQSLPKKITSVDKAKKTAAMLSLAQQDLSGGSSIPVFSFLGFLSFLHSLLASFSTQFFPFDIFFNFYPLI